nr:hypothetical protein [Tanacetum cinerariifolium]
MTYVHLLEILKRLVPSGFEKVYYCKSNAKLSSIREIKSNQDIVDLLKVGYDNGFQIDMYVDHFSYDIMEMVEWDRNKELRKTRIKSESDSGDDDYHYSDDDLEEIENVDFHTEGDDNVVIKNIATQYLFLTKLCSARIMFRYFKQIIEDPFMPLRKMRDDIRQKFMIDYNQALLDSNPGSTCTLDVVESDNGSVSFKGMYIYFKRVKDGWLAGGRKDDQCLNDGTGITIISDSHKGLIDAVND